MGIQRDSHGLMVMASDWGTESWGFKPQQGFIPIPLATLDPGLTHIAQKNILKMSPLPGYKSV